MDDDTLGMLMVAALFTGAICGRIGAILAARKNLRTWAGMLLGFFFGPLGLILIAVTPSTPDPAPKGMKSVVCTTCNARQNVPADDQVHDCWQCKRQLTPSL